MIFSCVFVYCYENFEKMIVKIVEIKGENLFLYVICVFNLYNLFFGIEIVGKWIIFFNLYLEILVLVFYVKIVDVYSIFKGNE